LKQLDERAEPSVFFSEKDEKMYIISGILSKSNSEFEVLDDILVLDIKKIPAYAWQGHP